MDKSLIPKKLQHLIPMANEWGIGDDGYRDEYIENSSNEKLEKFINSITENELDYINNWLCDRGDLINTEEYEKFTSLYMAFEYAESVLKNRNKSNGKCRNT